MTLKKNEALLRVAQRAGSAIAGSFALVCGIGTGLSGVTLMHPLLAMLLFIASIGFYFMSFGE